MITARNALKAYFRGRPLSEWMPKWNPRFGYPTAADLLAHNGGDAARVIARSGGTSIGWTAGIIGVGAAKTAVGVANASERK